MVTIKPVSPACAASLKAVRLTALRDAPSAFGSTFAKESALSDAEWEQRIAEWNGLRAIRYLAWDADRPCGIVGGVLDRERPATAHLVSMWVAPTHRRRGVGRLLVAGVIRWAVERRAETLCLIVTSSNDGAARFYERLGFTKTGKTEPYPNDPALVEFEMVRPIGRADPRPARPAR